MISLARAGISGRRVSFPSTASVCGYKSGLTLGTGYMARRSFLIDQQAIDDQHALTVVTGFHEDLVHDAASVWRRWRAQEREAKDPSATVIYCEEEFPDGTQRYHRTRGRVHFKPAHRLARGVKSLSEARLRAKANSRAVEKAVRQGQELDSVCTGDTHVHVQCQHGFVLISGLQDASIKPVCHRKQCKVEAERWLRSEGLTHGQLVGAINSVCTGLPPLPDATQEQAVQVSSKEIPATINAKALLEAERESFTFEEARDYLRGIDPAFSSAFVGVGTAIGAIGTFKTRLFKPHWSAEINATQQQMWYDFTESSCLGDFFELDPRMLPWIFLLVITLPCTDFVCGSSTQSAADDQTANHGGDRDCRRHHRYKQWSRASRSDQAA